MAIRKKKQEKLDYENIQRVADALSSTNPVTKKEACEMLNISYNTTRLNRILEDFNETMTHRATRKAQLKGTKATDMEIKQVIESYLNEHPISDIAQGMYRSSTFVKNILNRVGVPLKRPATEQGLSNKTGYLPEECVSETFEPNEKVWHAGKDLPARVIKELPNYESKYGSKCYQIYVIELTNFESPYFGFIKEGGYYATSLAYDLGSLTHLQKYGAEI